MIEQIDPTVFYQVHPGEFHDLPDLGFIFTMIALGLALFTHGFGIVRTLEPHRQTVSKESGAFRAERDFFSLNGFDIEQPKAEGDSRSIMVFPAVDLHEPDQCPNIDFLPVRYFSVLCHDVLSPRRLLLTIFITQAGGFFFDLSQPSGMN